MVSCKNKTVKSSSEMEQVTEDVRMDLELEEFYVPEETTTNNKTETFEFKELTTEKLQELYDVLTLIQKHPKFKDSLTSQLKTFTKDSLAVPKSLEITIDSLRLKGSVLKPNDSTQKMKLLYNVTSKNNKTQDSIWAEITFKTINVDGKQMQSKKLKFNKIK
ncbi:hypothetical protein CW733_08500 [Lacinutrix sp. Bg11-31]|nr:hypothetical protein CW733_08500 [Lacinutrix sp. Bg11-31]